MKKYIILTVALAATAMLGLVGCSEQDPPEILDFTVTPDTMNAGDTIMGMVETANFTLASHDDGGDDHHHDVDDNSGHFHIYLDDLMTNPLSMPDVNPFEIPMPVDATPGEHTLIVRLQRLDHTIVEPQVTFSTTITVQ